MNKLNFVIFLLIPSVFLFACLDDKGKDSKRKDCSVAPRCENQSGLAIRLRQVETYYYEQESDTATSFIDLAQFDYNENDQWIGGVTSRVAESDFEYIIEYSNGKMSRSTKSYHDDLDQTAEVVINYSYDLLGELDISDSFTEIRDENDLFVKSIDETFDYTFINGLLDDIHFSVDDDGDISSFHYEFTYEGGRIKDILITQQSSGKPDYIFKSFNYVDDGKVSSSISYRLNNSNQHLEQETVNYEYYQDGPIKIKTALINSVPKQKVETRYKWAAGECTTNQTFGDRLFPTPEIPNFPCL